MLKWLQISVLIAACSGLGCSADADRSNGGSRRGQPGAGGKAGASGAANAGSGAAGLGDIGMPVTPPPSSGTMAPEPAPDGGECGAVSQTAQNTLQPADIIIGIDTSGSMDDEIAFVQQNLNAFSQQIIDSGVDVRVILIATEGMTMPEMPGGIFGGDGDQEIAVCIDPPLGSGNCPVDSNPPRYLHVPVEVASHDALNLFVETYAQWQAQLRPNATKTFVVVTDDNAEDEPNNTAAAFMQAVAGLDPMLFAQWSFSGIYCFSECPEAAEIGTVYQDLVTQTGGVGGDLCLQDFASVFDALARSVIGASKLDCEWAIPPAPPGQTFDTGRVNVEYTATGARQTVFHVDVANQCAARGGWYYDDNANPTRLLVCPSTCELLQADGSAELDVLFGCKTKDGPD